MKHIRKFNEGLTDFFNKRKVKENPEEPKEVRTPGSSYYATLEKNGYYYVYFNEDSLGEPVAKIKEFDGYFILYIFGLVFNFTLSKLVIREKIKTKSIEQALKYLEKSKKVYLKRDEKESQSLEFDKDISDEDF